MIIAHNIAAQNTNRNLGITNTMKNKASERLLSGYKVNRAADNSAGLAISEKMRAQIRGLSKASDNTDHALNLLQVADGALEEVHSILHRMKELTVQAGNDTYVDDDRKAIQMEVDCLAREIDRIGSSTEFNTRKLFMGSSKMVLNANGNPVDMENIPFSDITIAEVSLNNGPFAGNSSSERLHLSAHTIGDYAGLNWNLIYGSGSTSYSTLRISYTNSNGSPTKAFVKLNALTPSNFTYDSDTNTYSRTLHAAASAFGNNVDSGVSFDIIQTIHIGDNNGENQYYDISYEVQNTGSVDASVDFMFHADTAYSNNDRAEGYYIDGQRLLNTCLYTSNPEYTGISSPNIHNISGINSGTGFSIVNNQKALPFSENIIWNDTPDTISFGVYSQIREWDYYNSLTSRLGQNTVRPNGDSIDMGFSFIWNDDITAGDSNTYSFQYGIHKTTTDRNLDGVPIKFDKGVSQHTEVLDLWIQSGANAKQGVTININEMNAGILGVDDIDVKTSRAATLSIDKVDEATVRISNQRSYLGAQYNRLEHNAAVDDLTAENLTNAESRIRDTDMAEEMVNFSKASILQQAGQAMLAQVNQSPQGIITLLSQ